MELVFTEDYAYHCIGAKQAGGDLAFDFKRIVKVVGRGEDIPLVAGYDFVGERVGNQSAHPDVIVPLIHSQD